MILDKSLCVPSFFVSCSLLGARSNSSHISIISLGSKWQSIMVALATENFSRIFKKLYILCYQNMQKKTANGGGGKKKFCNLRSTQKGFVFFFLVFFFFFYCFSAIAHVLGVFRTMSCVSSPYPPLEKKYQWVMPMREINLLMYPFLAFSVPESVNYRYE